MEERILVGRGFKARSFECGMVQPDTRSTQVLEIAARIGLIVLNIGTTSTFRHSVCESTILAVTFATEAFE